MRHRLRFLAALAAAVPMLVGIAAAAAPALISTHGIWRQGELITGHVAPGSQLKFKDQNVRVGDDGAFVIGLDRDEVAEVTLQLRTPDGQSHDEHHKVQARHYDIQRINGLPPGQVNAPPELQARVDREAQLAHDARFIDSPRSDYAQGFRWPATGRISGIYGSQRILNGEKKQPHYGVDVAVPIGTPVHAPAGGVVTLAEPDLYYTGGTLMIDHGHGVTSAFLHLSQLKLKVGDVVKPGEVIALSGMSGRATGPHLDWRVSWFDARVDAQRLVPPMPTKLSPASKIETRKRP